MDWRKRLLGIAVAGGTVAVGTAGCFGGGGGACNANPDPCCGLPQGQVCPQKQDCEQKGGTWAFGGVCELDGGADADASNPFGDASNDDGGDAADQ